MRWTSKMVKLPNPNTTDDIKFMRSFVDKFGKRFVKIWAKERDGISGLMKYKLESIYYTGA